MNENFDPNNVKERIKIDNKEFNIFKIDKLKEYGLDKISQLPFSIKILLESIVRQFDGQIIKVQDIKNIANWTVNNLERKEIPFKPARVILQDFTGVPAVVDLAAMRSALYRLGKDPSEINPVIPADLIIDHSIQVNYFGTKKSRELNEKKEFTRNKERYSLLKWAQNSFNNFRVIPPGRGIIHQINLEYLASVIQMKKVGDELYAYPDTVLGTDSHTTMIGGLGIVGWGVGGIEAEAVMLGQPYYLSLPGVVGVKLYGKLDDDVCATDIVLSITELLRRYGVVGKFIEFFGTGLKQLSLPDRATISNMAPEYGATIGYFPIDTKTLEYLELSGRNKELVNLVKKYTIEQGLFLKEYNNNRVVYSKIIEFDLGNVVPSLAGPKRPQDRVSLIKLKDAFKEIVKNYNNSKSSSINLNNHNKNFKDNKFNQKQIQKGFGNELYFIDEIVDGTIVLAAITSCTNTSNPNVLIGAGLLAKKAIEHGLKVKPFIKTSLAPGSRVVKDYLEKAGLLPYLEGLGFHIVGYGCTTCIGNSGHLFNEIEKIILNKNIIAVSIISGNRNFEGRVHPLIKASYLASPMLVIAFAIAGNILINLKKEPLGYDPNGDPVYLSEIWPTNDEIMELIDKNINSSIFKKQYSNIFEGTEQWNSLEIQGGKLFKWDKNSTYILEPPFFKDFSIEMPKLSDIKNARCLAILGDSITTDHISPAGSIPKDSPAGQYLISHNININSFNSFGSRRGNHEVMIRGTFSNIRLKNKLTPNREGGWTIYLPTNEEMPIYNAAMKYLENGIPTIIFAGKEYGTGSSRDWAAKGTQLLGIKAVIAESFERIHRSNLIGMGVLPLQFKSGENIDTLGIKGDYLYDIIGLNDLGPNKELNIIIKDKNQKQIKKFKVEIRLDNLMEVKYYRNGGILQTVLRNMLKNKHITTF